MEYNKARQNHSPVSVVVVVSVAVRVADGQRERRKKKTGFLMIIRARTLGGSRATSSRWTSRRRFSGPPSQVVIVFVSVIVCVIEDEPSGNG